MKNISPKEAIEVLKDMKIDIPLPEAAVMQRKRNAAIDMAIDALKYSEIPNSSDCISRQAAIEVADAIWCVTGDKNVAKVWDQLKDLPSAQPDIIRCNACKHWTQTTGNMPGFGLGDCDYLNAKLVNCNGYCYWAERREE